MTTFTALPQDVLVVILSQLEIEDIGHAGRVSKTMHTAANDESLWEILAIRRFGSHVALSTRYLYNTYQEMVLDDNRSGAMPTLNGLWKCPWRYNNRTSRFYCCLVVCIKWHRPSNNLWLYIDARGESDLRRPGTSGIWLRDLGTNNRLTLEDRLTDRIAHVITSRFPENIA